MASTAGTDETNLNLPLSIERLSELVAARDNEAPVPILSRRADTRVIRDLRDLARVGCDAQVRALAECFEGRMFSVIWHCRSLNKAVEACMAVYTLDESLKDEMRRRHGARFPRAVSGYREASSSSSSSNVTSSKPGAQGVTEANAAP